MKALSVVAACVLIALTVVTRGDSYASTPKPVQGVESLVGLSVPSQIAQIAPEQSGSIVYLPVAEGDVVEKGQTLFKLSSLLQQLEVDRLKSQYESDLPLERARVSLDYARKQETRFRELANKKITSGSELQDRELDSALAKIKLSQAEFDRQQTKNELDKAQERLDQRTLSSPLSGIVSKRFKHPGETAEQLKPVVEVISLDPLWVEFECPVTKQGLYQVGSFVLVSPASDAEAVRPAKIVHASMTANPSSHTFLVRAAAPNADSSWKAGLKMLIRVPDANELNPSAPTGK